MRPKKVVLCVHSDPRELSIRKFMLVTRGYNVLAAANSADAVALASTNAIDVILVDLGPDPEAQAGKVAKLGSKAPVVAFDGDAIVVALKAVKPHIPALLTSSAVGAGERTHSADAFLGRGCCSPAELLDRLRIMAQRKRGRRKPVLYLQPINHALEVA